MQAAIERVLDRDGIVTRARLVAEGVSDRRIRAAVAAGELIRLRQGVFSRPGFDPTLAEAVSAGGRSGCVTELHRLGAWVTVIDRVHVHLPPHGSRARSSPAAVVRHWAPLRRQPTPTHVSPVDALAQASCCLSGADMVATLDSAIRQQLVAEKEISGIRSLLDGAISRSDGSADSGLESLMRLALQDLGLDVRSQVLHPGIGKVDLLVEGRIVVELDGEEHHRSPASRSRDRDRDAAAMSAGYLPLHFGYRQVVFQRSLAARAVVNAVRTHRGVKSSGRIAAAAQRRLDAPGST